MNFLEQLVAEWYEDQGYFIRRNVKIGKRSKGGYEGEIDVLAFDFERKQVVHVETSTDADSWKTRVKKFEKKFTVADKHYKDIFSRLGLPDDVSVIKKVIAGVGKKRGEGSLGRNIQLVSIREFMAEVNETMMKRDPMKNAVPENLGLLRAIQFSAFYGKSRSVRS